MSQIFFIVIVVIIMHVVVIINAWSQIRYYVLF